MNRAVHFSQGLFSLRGYAIKLFGPAATLGSGFAAPGLYEPLLLQPIKTRVDSSDCDILFRPMNQFLTDCYSVRAIVEPQNR